MNEDLRRRYVRDLITDLDQVGGARLEQWIRPLWDHLAGGSVNARGLNPQGDPVAGTLDAFWPDGSVSEASSDAHYFTKPYKKPRHDFRHVLAVAPAVRTVRLFSTQEAGPKAITHAECVKHGLARRRYVLDLWDGRRIAEYIVDQLLIDERFVERVGDALPNLRRISEQNAASARVPTLDPLYRGRDDDEVKIITDLKRNKCVVLFGFGGIGKSEIACSVAHRLRDEFEFVIWADGDRLGSFENLRAFDVRLNGYKLNMLDLLTSHKTLLVLDNIGVDIDTGALAATCGPESCVLITSRVEFGGNVVPIEFVDREHAREILSADTAVSCPDAVLDTILQTVNGHPLVLRMLNRFATQGHDWSVIEQQCSHIVGAPDEKRQTIAARILEQHLDVLGRELAFFAWCGTSSVDSGLFDSVFGLVGIDKLQRWALTARGQSDAIRLHDVVYASVERLKTRLPLDVPQFEAGIEYHLSTQMTPKGLGFFRVVSRHRELIERLLTAQPRPGVLRYAYLHGYPASRLLPALIGDPSADAAGGSAGDRRAWLLSIVETIEADYRRVRDLGDQETAKATLESRLQTFDLLVADQQMTSEELEIVQHHKAKSLLKLGRTDEALAVFEALASDCGTHYATKLQIARLISKQNSERAKALIFEIIEAEHAAPGSVATSVLLETLCTLRRGHLRRFVGEMTEKYGSFMAQQIKAAACSGENQPIRAFASVGSQWSYKSPELFMEVLEEIDLGSPEDAEDDDERVAIGRLLTAAGKILLRQRKVDEARQRFEQSVAFFVGVAKRSSFYCTHHADALLRLDRAKEAAKVLDEVPPNEHDAFWLLRRSESHLALKEHPEALKCIDEALNFDLQERLSTFLVQRADVLFAMKDPSHERELREAIQLCDDPQYRDDLKSKLEQRMS